MRPIRRVLVVFKASRLERYADRGSLPTEIGDDPDLRAVHRRIRAAHEEHAAAAARVEEILARSGLEVMLAMQIRKADARRADLVIPVGGDGTFMWCARKVDGVPMLGVNSAPGTSTGHYCAARVESLAELLGAIRDGAMEPRRLVRINARIDGRLVPYPALNDVLFCHRSPAASSRYLLRIGDQAELQLSSGIWIATASGSTGGILSAGGEVMGIDDERLQFLVREPYLPPEAVLRLTRGFVDGALTLVSRSPNNMIFLDGHNVSYATGFGSRLEFSRAPEPLLVYAYGGAAR